MTDRCPLPPGSRVVGYFRDSGGDEQERSVDQQRRVAEKYCQQHHLVLVQVFADKPSPAAPSSVATPSTTDGESCLRCSPTRQTGQFSTFG